jgi:hypothetical protein
MKRHSKARNRGPALTLGQVALWAASLGLGAFGVAGWIASADSLAAQVVFASAAGLAACVIPACVHHIGRGWVSGLLALAVLPFGFIAAYSTHHANEVLAEAPRKAAFVAEAEAQVRTWTARVETAQAKLDAHAPLVLTPGMPLERVREQDRVWADQHAPLVVALADARSGHAAAVVARDERAAAYQPMAPDLAVWAVSGSIDLAIVIGISVLGSIARRKPKAEKPVAKKPNKTPKVRATAPVGRKDWKPTLVGS